MRKYTGMYILKPTLTEEEIKANVEEIKVANDLGVICGVTTNPSLIAKEGRDFQEVVKEITTIVDGPISAEVISLDHAGMVAEAEELVKIHENIVIKIPMTLEGLKAVKILAAKGVKARVISMPCWELYEAQDAEYKESVMPKAVRARLAVEAASDFGWHKYVGMDGDIICMDGFGASAPAGLLFKDFGFTVENVVEKALALVK